MVRSTVPIPVYVWSHEQTEIDLDLPAGSQSLDLAVEPPLAAGAGQAPQPAFEADFARLAAVAGTAVLRIDVPRELPAGRYLRRVLIRATGEPVGTLTVQVGQVGNLPPVVPTARRKASPNTGPNAGPNVGPNAGPKAPRSRKKK